MAAGLGFKTFQTGEVLTASDVNGYLMQGILVFATEAARNSAITSPQEGQFAFTKDNNSLWYYTGSAWVASGATGDIEGVTAGVGISGGGTSGTVTITNSMATTIDAKGDLIVGTGDDTFARLAVGGTNGHTLQVDSSTATGLKWAAAAGGGKVLQVVQGSTATQTNSSTNTYVDTGLTATITPSATSSKILVMVSHAQVQKSSGNALNRIAMILLRGATTIYPGFEWGYMNSAVQLNTGISFSYLDSPSTTSATTYKTQFQSSNNTAEVGVQQNNTTSTILLLEIGA